MRRRLTDASRFHDLPKAPGAGEKALNRLDLTS
jgi:hypothetical protein